MDALEFARLIPHDDAKALVIVAPGREDAEILPAERAQGGGGIEIVAVDDQKVIAGEMLAAAEQGVPGAHRLGQLLDQRIVGDDALRRHVCGDLFLQVMDDNQRAIDEGAKAHQRPGENGSVF